MVQRHYPFRIFPSSTHKLAPRKKYPLVPCRTGKRADVRPSRVQVYAALPGRALLAPNRRIRNLSYARG